MSRSTSCRYANCDSFGPLHLQTNIKVIVRLICLYVFLFFFGARGNLRNDVQQGKRVPRFGLAHKCVFFFFFFCPDIKTNANKGACLISVLVSSESHEPHNGGAGNTHKEDVRRNDLRLGESTIYQSITACRLVLWKEKNFMKLKLLPLSVTKSGYLPQTP